VGWACNVAWNVKIWPAVVDLSESVAYVTELPAGEVVPASCAPCDAATESRFLRSQDSARGCLSRNQCFFFWRQS
jgi:hypothetical protein